MFSEDLTIEHRCQIASSIADIFARMERASFPSRGRLVASPGIPDRCNDFSTISTGVDIAPFKIYDGEVLGSTSSPSVADFMGSILDMYYETSQIDGKYLLPRCTRLREINQEIKAKGLLTCQRGFFPRKQYVGRTNENNWEVTAVPKFSPSADLGAPGLALGDW